MGPKQASSGGRLHVKEGGRHRRKQEAEAKTERTSNSRAGAWFAEACCGAAPVRPVLRAVPPLVAQQTGVAVAAALLGYAVVLGEAVLGRRKLLRDCIHSSRGRYRPRQRQSAGNGKSNGRGARVCDRWGRAAGVI